MGETRVNSPAERQPFYAFIRQHARRIVSLYPVPGFYRDFAHPYRLSQDMFKSEPAICSLRRRAAMILEDDFGHGLKHAIKVALDIGTLMLVEGERAGYSPRLLRRRVTVAQAAALLHDIRRKEDDHAEKGAVAARSLLAGHPFSPAEIGDICTAIRNHEAFKPTVPINTPEGVLVSDCLYDADKFRWGPDNFSDTLWRMASFSHMSLDAFIRQFPKGLEALARIRGTFRTPTGKIYGPQFIDLGLAIGKTLYAAVQEKYAED